MRIHTLDTTQPKISMITFPGLPDEASFMLVSERAALAKKCGQPFTLELFDWRKHQRAFCVGFTESENSIALFYISDTGLYTWICINNIYIVPEIPSNKCTSLPIEKGITYWFTPSIRGDTYYKAKVLGSYSDIGKRYHELHQPPESKTSDTLKRRNKKTDDDENGAPPVHHLQDDFSLLTSFDDFGL